jgi:hypothetical protein
MIPILPATPHGEMLRREFNVAFPTSIRSRNEQAVRKILSKPYLSSSNWYLNSFACNIYIVRRQRGRRFSYFVLSRTGTKDSLSGGSFPTFKVEAIFVSFINRPPSSEPEQSPSSRHSPSSTSIILFPAAAASLQASQVSYCCYLPNKDLNLAIQTEPVIKSSYLSRGPISLGSSIPILQKLEIGQMAR